MLPYSSDILSFDICQQRKTKEATGAKLARYQRQSRSATTQLWKWAVGASGITSTSGGGANDGEERFSDSDDDNQESNNLEVINDIDTSSAAVK